MAAAWYLVILIAVSAMVLHLLDSLHVLFAIVLKRKPESNRFKLSRQVIVNKYIHRPDDCTLQQHCQTAPQAMCKLDRDFRECND